jgi:hypothetical protein
MQSRLKVRYCKLLFGVLLIASLFTEFGCLENATQSIDNAVNQIRETTGVFEEQSQQWQQTLKGLADDLDKKGQRLLANDLRNFTDRAVSGTGTEFRCNADFIRDRLTQTLENLKDAIKNKRSTFDRVPPAICNFSPPRVDIIWEDHDHFKLGTTLTTIEAYGYDLNNLNSRFKLYIRDNESNMRDTSSSLSFTTSYMLQITLASSGVLFQEGDRQLVLDWKDKLQHEIPITWGSRPDPMPPAEMVTALKIVVHTTSDDKDREVKAVFTINANSEIVAEFDAGKGEVWHDWENRTFLVPGQATLAHPVPVGKGIKGILTVQALEDNSGWDVYFELIGITTAGRTLNYLTSPAVKYGEDANNTHSHEFTFNW